MEKLLYETQLDRNEILQNVLIYLYAAHACVCVSISPSIFILLMRQCPSRSFWQVLKIQLKILCHSLQLTIEKKADFCAVRHIGFAYIDVIVELTKKKPVAIKLPLYSCEMQHLNKWEAKNNWKHYLITKCGFMLLCFERKISPCFFFSRIWKCTFERHVQYAYCVIFFWHVWCCAPCDSHTQ